MFWEGGTLYPGLWPCCFTQTMPHSVASFYGLTEYCYLLPLQDLKLCDVWAILWACHEILSIPLKISPCINVCLNLGETGCYASSTKVQNSRLFHSKKDQNIVVLILEISLLRPFNLNAFQIQTELVYAKKKNAFTYYRKIFMLFCNLSLLLLA